MTQSIIVYRNPLEAAMWETIMESHMVWPIMVATFFCILAAVFTDKIIRATQHEMYRRRIGHLPRVVVNYVPLLAGALTWVGIIYYMV